ncbi:MAG: RNA polymerase recycling motor HelD [Bacillota bacterium]
MSTDTKSLSYEKSWLNRVLSEVQVQLKEKSTILEEHRSELIRTNRSMWEDVSSAGPDDVNDLERMVQAKLYMDELRIQGLKYEFAGKLKNKLEKMLESPYFGRIDFAEAGENDTESLYIGLSTLANSKGDFLVYDWRAPVSSMFYDYEVGRASYHCPAGEVEGELLFKRQYRIYKGDIEYMFDCSLKIDDEVLQEALGRNSDSKMKTIVTTIQREQNAVIRDDKHRLLIVQGAAGSGKTSVALHRIAYILYKHRETVSPENIVVFSPNRIFNDYIADVLPELGEENMRQTTFMECAANLLGTSAALESSLQQMEYILGSKQDHEYTIRMKNIRYKSSPDFLQFMKSFIRYIETEWIDFEDIVFKNDMVISREELKKLFYEDFSAASVSRRLEKIKQRIYYLLEPYQEKRLKEIAEELKNSKEYIEDYQIEDIAKSRHSEEIKPLFELIERLTAFDHIRCYRQLFGDTELMERLSSTDSKKKLDDIASFTLRQLDKQFIPYEDVIALAYMRIALGYTPNMSSIKHVVIDEMQDYTELQLEIIKKIFPYSGFTILGDINQSINSKMHTVTAKAIAETFNIDNSLTVVLSKSYRSTKEIADFSRAILSDESELLNVNRRGSKPKLINIKNMNSAADIIIEDIKSLKEQGCKSIAVICRTAADAGLLFDQISKGTEAALITDDEKEFKKGTVVLPSYLTKGLEFDAVIVADAGAETYSEDDRKLFYTICTRALHQLHIYFNVTPSCLIKYIDPLFYESTN